MVTVRNCGYKGCGNPVREGQVRCYLHVTAEVESGNPFKVVDAQSAAEMKAQWETMRAITAIVHRKPFSSLSMNERQAEFVAQASRLSLQDSLKVAEASEIIARRRPELNIPAYVAQNRQMLLDEMENDLAESGIARHRITRLQMWGVSRKLDGGRIERDRDIAHVVTVIDQGQPNESTVDVGISMFAPVADPYQPVADQMDTKFTPFGYAPLVSVAGTYKQRNYLWFDNFRYLDS